MMRPRSARDASIDCCALITKFSVTCSSSVKLAWTFRDDVVSTSSTMPDAVEIAAPELDDLGDHVAQVDGRSAGPLCWLLKRDRLRMISRARPLCVFRNAISSSASGDMIRLMLEQLRRAENGLQRVVQFVCDAGDQHANRGQAFLPDDLPLERVQRLVHLALLLDLAIQRIARVAEVAGHLDERVLQLRELAVRRRDPGRRRQVAVGDLFGRRAQAIDVERRLRRDQQAEREQRQRGRR